MEKVPHPDYEAERDRLLIVLDYLRTYYSQISKQKKSIEGDLEEALKKYDPDNMEQYTEVMIKSELQKNLITRTKASEKSLLKPYFSRVDFQQTGETETFSYYIGKMSILRDGDKVPLVVDWRAPVATLYYEGRIGQAAYECPEGEIKGEISLKRQYFIENGVLNDFFDIDITANDEFLQAALGSSKDKRLKDIVSTIQAEQNKVIRADMLKPVIVQGAAGGGKTTIALHRIAYLLYNYQRVNPHNIMIIAPNRFFLSYISEVLPDLGVEDVLQTTFEDFAFDFIGKRLKIKRPDEKLASLLKKDGNTDLAVRSSVIKSSLVFQRVIERYINYMIETSLPDKDFAIGEYILTDFKRIKALFQEEYAFLPISKRTNEIKKHLSNTLKRQKPGIIREINNRCDAELVNVKRGMPEDSLERRAIIANLLDSRDAELSTVTKRSAGLAGGYFKGIKFKPAHEIYKDFFGNSEVFARCCEGLIEPVEAENMRKATWEGICGNCHEIEDLAPVMYIHYMFYGSEHFDIRHIVIDEAQDASLFQIFILKKIMGTGSFSILGDLCQGIYSFRGITDWNDVSEQVFDGDARLMTLEQSYRTTVEIMDFANIVVRKLKLLSVPEAKPVIRHGEEVRVEVFDSLPKIAGEIKRFVEMFVKRGHRSVAVICKTAEECTVLKEMLNIRGAEIITGKESDYSGGIVLIPAYLSKGLEFDAVIVADAGSERYGFNEIDIKLLYVAMTRALHELVIFAKDELSPVLVPMSTG